MSTDNTSCTLLGGKCDCAPNSCKYTPGSADGVSGESRDVLGDMQTLCAYVKQQDARIAELESAPRSASVRGEALTDAQILRMSDEANVTFISRGSHRESPYQEGYDTSADVIKFARSLLATSTPAVQPAEQPQDQQGSMPPVAAPVSQHDASASIHCQEFHELAMDYRGAGIMQAHRAYSALTDYIDARLAASEASASPLPREADILLAGIQAVCVSASQEYTRCNCVMPQWDGGFFAGQLHVFDMYTKADRTAINEARDYLANFAAAPDVAQPAAHGDDMTLPRNLVQRISHALHCADVLIDAVPTALQNDANPSISRIGKIVNEQGAYRIIADAKAELYAFLSGAPVPAPLAEQSWISVADRLPWPEPLPDGSTPVVLVKWKRESRADNLPDIDVSNAVYLARNVESATHWMPLPASPQGAENNQGEQQ